MKFRIRTPVIVTAGLLILLPVIAAIQYRWLGQVSEAEHERMRANLRNSALLFTDEFEREISRLFAQSRFRGEGDEPLAEVSAVDSPLVKTTYKSARNPDGSLGLWEVDPATGESIDIEWPADLASLRSRIQNFVTLHLDVRRSTEGSFVFRATRPSVVIGGPLGLVAPEVPAIAVPVPLVTPPGLASLEGFSTFVILRLDLEYVRSELIPSLVARHFGEADNLDYLISVFREHDGEVTSIYESDPGGGWTGVEPDHKTWVLRFRPDQLGTLISGPRSIESEDVEPGRMAVAMRFLRREPGSDPAVAAREDGWQVAFRHKSGSLETAVGRARTRNLLVSLGILVLLAGSLTLIVLSAQRAQQLARKRMEFVAGVSHEFRTPLAVIHSAAENLADGVVRDSDGIRRYGSLIRKESDRLTDMVERVLEFAGVESGRKKYRLTPVNALEICQTAVESCRSQFEEEGVSVELDIEEGLPSVRADGEALSRVIQNLLTNALKYRGDSNQVRLKVTRGSYNEVRVSVRDSGIGIPPDELKDIFEPFFRGREVMRAQIRGNGLGLSLARRVVEAHGGRLSVESARGSGSVFTVLLPAVDETATGDGFEIVPGETETRNA